MASTEHWIKVLEFGRREIVSLAHCQGATLKVVRGQSAIYDIYFTHTAVPLREKLEIQLRLRWQNDKKRVTISWDVKGPPEVSQQGETRKTFNNAFPESWWGDILNLLDHLGFTPHTRRMKIRWVIRVIIPEGTADVQIDQYPGIPKYAEITGPPEVCEKIANVMGVPNERRTRMTAGEVFSHYGIADSTNVLFAEGSKERKLFAQLPL